MPTAVAVHWNTCKGGVWGELPAVNLDHPHFNNLEGVFVAWTAGDKPLTVAVGKGMIRAKLKELRHSGGVQLFNKSKIFITWAQVDVSVRDGVERFLAESLQPQLKPEILTASPIEVNLPGRPAPEGLTIPPPPGEEPTQGWEMLVAPGKDPSALQIQDVEHIQAPEKREEEKPVVLAAPKLKKVTRLQKTFDDLVDKTLKKTETKSGLFGGGGGAVPKPKEDMLMAATIQLIMDEAVRSHASDIHIEPLETAIRVRFRVDGILEEALIFPKSLNLRIVSYIRVACQLDPEQSVATGKPQDGRMAVVVDGKESDLRLSTFPTPHGEKAVLRVIPRNVKVPSLDELGLRPETIARLQILARVPQGMIVVTGPAGSGKSTTLYTVLQMLNEPTRNIVTLEDPIELKIQGVSQGAINPKAGFTFAEGLKSILRQDPNVVMVGEIRDAETAEIAMSAALTGHVLFTTLHTTSALGAVARLLDMGMEPYLVASALTAVFAQRLARKICVECKQPTQAPPEQVAHIEDLCRRQNVPFDPEVLKTLQAGKGCQTCRDTGYRGRLLLFEIVEMSQVMRDLILKKASIDDMRKAAVEQGNELMLADGLRKAASGVTTLAEIVRVAGGQ